MPSQGQVYLFDGSRVRLLGPHPSDPANVWVARTLNDSRQMYIGTDWLSEHEPVNAEADTVPASGQAPVEVESRATAVVEDNAGSPVVVGVTPAPAGTTQLVNQEELEEIPAEDRPTRRRRARRPECPACEEHYEGILGVDHSCAAVLSVRCKACHAVNVQHLETPPRPPYLCTACVAAGKFICKSCAQPQATRGRYHDICDSCNPLPAVNIWAAIDHRARGDEMTLETKSHRPYAVEVESFLMPDDAVTPRARLTQGWHEAQDGSIRADQGATENVEFRSPPFKGDGGLRLLHDGVRKIRDMGFRANKSCGLHCHVDMISSSVEDRKALYKFGNWVQEDIYKLVARSRTNGQYCKKLSTTMDRADRYVWLNMRHAFDRHRTCEFRLHHGTTQPDRIVEWVKVCLRIVEMGLKLGRSRTRPDGSMFDLLGFNAYEREYWTDVARSLHGADVAFTANGA